MGGSCILAEIDGYHILMDCGIRQGAGRDPLPDFRSVQENGGVDAILVSHAHMDHTGSLPVISRAYPQARIYMTPMTMDLTRILLSDSIKLMNREEGEIPKYTEEDVSSMLERCLPVRFEKPLEVLPGLTATFYPAGHIGGAACILLQGQEGTLLYTGDISLTAQRTIEGASIPRLRPDVMIMESTYGNRLHANRQAEEARLLDCVRECLEQERKILIPVFAVGRSQEVLLILKGAMEKKELPEVPVYVDGMVRDTNTAYMRNSTDLRNQLARKIDRGLEPFYSDQIRAVRPMEDREALLARLGCAIFVTSSGMLSGGPSVQYAKKLVTSEKACILLTGYQDEESPGRKLLKLLEEDEEKKIQLDGLSYPVRCRVEQIGLSAHADEEELCMLTERLSPRRIVLVHGDSEAISALGDRLAADWHREIYSPVCGETVELDIRVKRKQESARLDWTLSRSFSPDEGGASELWKFCRLHYPNWKFLPEQLFSIWYGRESADEAELSDFVCGILGSPWFTRFEKRLHRIRLCTEEEAAEKGKEKEATIQEVEALLGELAAAEGITIRKLSFFPEEKRVLLLVNFPDALDCLAVKRLEEEVREKTGWSFGLSSVVNHQEMQNQLRARFPMSIKKISFFVDRREYRVMLSGKPDAAAAGEASGWFMELTGWSLVLLSEDGLTLRPEAAGEETNIETRQVRMTGAQNPADESSLPASAVAQDWYFPRDGASRTEQNLAISCIDSSFEGEEISPGKCGIKNDHIGKYFELSFLTPELGRRQSDLLFQLSRQIGWRLHISESVNQNELFAIASELCGRYEVKVRKNPSWLPDQHVLVIRTREGGLPETLKEEFEERTGVRCVEG